MNPYLYANVVMPLIFSGVISGIALMLLKRYRTPVNAALFIVLPGLFAMFFGDSMFVLTFLLQTGGVDGIRHATGPADFVHDLFNSYADLIAIPLAFLLVYGIEKVASKYSDIKYPEDWVKILFWITLVNAMIATFILDALGY